MALMRTKGSSQSLLEEILITSRSRSFFIEVYISSSIALKICTNVILPRLRPKVDMSRQVQTESAYVQTVPDSKCLCPDRPRRKVHMSRLSCVQNFSCVLRAFEDKYVQTIPDRNSICPDFRAFLSRPSCAPTQIRAFNAKFLVRPCPDRRAVMSRSPCVQIQTIVRSCPDFRAFTRPKKNYILGCSAIP